MFVILNGSLFQTDDIVAVRPDMDFGSPAKDTKIWLRGEEDAHRVDAPCAAVIDDITHVDHHRNCMIDLLASAKRLLEKLDVFEVEQHKEVQPRCDEARDDLRRSIKRVTALLYPKGDDQ